MKKAYRKPQMAIEKFTLTQTIAATCNVDPAHQFGDPNMADGSACQWVYNNISYFLQGTACTAQVSADADIAGQCYNNPTGANTVFGS